MAISYYTGSLTPSSTTKADDIMNAYVGAFTSAIAAGKTNWSIADSGYVNTSCKRVVFNNSLGFSLMMVISTTTSVTTINWYLGQSYNATTHVLNNLAISNVGNRTWTPNYTLNADGIANGSSYNPTNISASTNTVAGPSPHGSNWWDTTASQTAWSAHIENDYAILSFNDGSTTSGKWISAGKFTTLVQNPALTDTYPFSLTWNYVNTYGANERGTSFLSATSLASGTNTNTIYSGGIAWGLGSDGSPAYATQIDAFSADPTKANVSPIYLSRYASNLQDFAVPVQGASSYGYLRGKLQGMYHAGGTNASWGDTVAITGVGTFMYVGGKNFNITSTTTSLQGWAKIA